MRKIICLVLLLSVCFVGVSWGEEEFYINVPGPEDLLIIKDPPMPVTVFPRISFYDGKNEVGSVDWSTGKVVFEGDIDESAKLFFRHLLHKHCGIEPKEE